MEPTELCKIGAKYKTDKTPSVGHGYTPFYHSLLAGKRVKRVLEIGIGGGPVSMSHIPDYTIGASLFMWEEFFPEAEIFALEINSDTLVNTGRIKSYVCDQSDEKSLRDAITKIGPGFDLIIDDGSHNPKHQILTANILVPMLNPGGLYIIEDVSDPSIVSCINFPCEVKEFNPEAFECHDDRVIVIKNTIPKVLIAFLGWVGGANRGDHQALRDTWLKETSNFPNMDHRFFIGDGTPIPPVEERAIAEQWQNWIGRNPWNKTHAASQTKIAAGHSFEGFKPQTDEIIGQYPDGYRYMSYKRKESLRWALEQGYDYIFCASVDVYARPERLWNSDFQKYDYQGLNCGNKGYPGTANYIPESYIFGGGYWLSAKAARIIVNSPVTYWCEDWWIGLALSKAVKNGEILRNDSSRYTIEPNRPYINNDIISVELSAGNYDKSRMYDCHARFSSPPVPIQNQRASRYDKSGLVQNWWDRHPRK
jgi:hypothetical protein